MNACWIPERNNIFHLSDLVLLQKVANFNRQQISIKNVKSNCSFLANLAEISLTRQIQKAATTLIKNIPL